MAIAFAGNASAAPNAYIANYFEDSVSVIDTATNTVIATIPVGEMPGYVAVSNDGTRAYVSNFMGINITVIDTVQNKAIASIDFDTQVMGVAVSPDGTKLYVATNEYDEDTETCIAAVVDTSSNTIIKNISIAINPSGIIVSPDGTKVYITCSEADCVSVINTLTDEVTDIPAGNSPTGVVVSPDGTMVYVANPYIGNITVIDATRNKALNNITLGSETFIAWLAISPDGTRLYATTEYTECNVTVIDTTTNTVIRNITLDEHLCGIAVNSAGTRLYVTCISEGPEFPCHVAVIDTETCEVTDMMTVGLYPMSYGMFLQRSTLSVSADPVAVPAGSSTEIRCTVRDDNGAPVNGAAVTLIGTGSGTGTTGSSGVALITVNPSAKGSITATATKAGFNSGATTLTVTEPTPTKTAPVVYGPPPTVSMGEMYSHFTPTPVPSPTVTPTPVVTPAPTVTATATTVPQITVTPVSTPVISSTPVASPTTPVEVNQTQFGSPYIWIILILVAIIGIGAAAYFLVLRK